MVKEIIGKIIENKVIPADERVKQVVNGFYMHFEKKIKKVDVVNFNESDIILKKNEYDIEELCEMLDIYNPDNINISLKADKNNLKIICKAS